MIAILKVVAQDSYTTGPIDRCPHQYRTGWSDLALWLGDRRCPTIFASPPKLVMSGARVEQPCSAPYTSYSQPASPCRNGTEVGLAVKRSFPHLAYNVGPTDPRPSAERISPPPCSKSPSRISFRANFFFSLRKTHMQKQ